MTPDPALEVSLDALAEAWLAGDQEASSALFTELHVRFFAIAKRRVQMDHVEDVVQDVLKIVLEKYAERGTGSGILIWGLTVLRNVIGNYYQARRRDGERLEYYADERQLPASTSLLEADLDAEEAQKRLAEAIAELAERYPRCGAIFQAILTSLEEEGSPREISTRALALVQQHDSGMKRNAFYVALHRCRGYLRDLLADQEGVGSHV